MCTYKYRNVQDVCVHTSIVTRNVQENFEDTKGVIRSRKLKNRKYNGQRKKDKKTNNDLQNTALKVMIEQQVTPLNVGGQLGCSGRISSVCLTSDICQVTVKRHEHHLVWKWLWTPKYVNKYQ